MSDRSERELQAWAILVILLLVLAALISLSQCGCCPTPAPEVRYVPQRVEVPVPVPCRAPARPSRPALAITALRPEAPPAEVVRAYQATCEQLAGYARELEVGMEACGATDPPGPGPGSSPP